MFKPTLQPQNYDHRQRYAIGENDNVILPKQTKDPLCIYLLIFVSVCLSCKINFGPNEMKEYAHKPKSPFTPKINQ